jgi:hypothetical protein
MKRTSWNKSVRWSPWLALLLAACGGSPTQPPPPPAKVVLSGSADELAAAALTSWASGASNASQALTQIQKAVQEAPQRPELLWLYLRICADAPSCQSEPIEAQLRKLDPGSGAVWLGPLARAQARRDASAQEQILEVMSKATHFNVYWTTLIAHLTPPISRTPAATSVAQAAPTPMTNALNVTITHLSRLDTRAFNAISTACDDQQIREPATRVRCDRIADALEKSDTTLAEGIGLGIAQRVTAPRSNGWMEVTEKINALRYQNQGSGAIVAAQVEKEKFSEQMLKLMGQLKREQDVSRAILRWAGQPLTP